MSCVTVSTEVIYAKRRERTRSEYKIDLWREARRRWLVAGVLAAVAAAAVWPRGGAPGGPLRAEYCVYLPLWYTYYAAGRRCRPRDAPAGDSGASARVLALGCLHAHAVAPALSVLAVEAFRGAGLNHRLVKGVVLSSAGAPCAWLSLACAGAGAARAGAAPALLAASYAASVLAAPLLMLILCGRATLPPLGGVLLTALTVVAPFTAGALRPARVAGAARARGLRRQLCALVVLYAECCARLRAAEGSLHVQDVLATLMLVVGYVCSSAGACWAYHRCGLLRRADAGLLVLVAVPKCLDPGWEYPSLCSPPGLAQLPAAFLAPAQALLLTALSPAEDDGADDSAGAAEVHSLPQ